MLTKAKKEEIVKGLTESLKNSKSVVFTDYRGLEVKDMTSLKKELKNEGAKMQVIKKKLMNIALKNAGIDVDVKDMDGQLSITVSAEDEVSPARIINKFTKDNENLKILGGILDSKEMTAEETIALAKMPSKEELLAKIVGSLNAPLSGFVNVLQGNQRNLVYAIKAIADSKN